MTSVNNACAGGGCTKRAGSGMARKDDHKEEKLPQSVSVCMSRRLFVAVPVLLVTMLFPVGTRFARSYREQRAINHIRHLRGVVYTDGGLIDRFLWEPPIAYIDLSGTDVASVDLIVLRDMNKVPCLYLNNTDLDNRSVVHLVQLKDLELLEIKGTSITNDGRKTLERALPKCRIRY